MYDKESPVVSEWRRHQGRRGTTRTQIDLSTHVVKRVDNSINNSPNFSILGWNRRVKVNKTKSSAKHLNHIVFIWDAPFLFYFGCPSEPLTRITFISGYKEEEEGRLYPLPRLSSDLVATRESRWQLEDRYDSGCQSSRYKLRRDAIDTPVISSPPSITRAIFLFFRFDNIFKLVSQIRRQSEANRLQSYRQRGRQRETHTRTQRGNTEASGASETGGHRRSRRWVAFWAVGNDDYSVQSVVPRYTERKGRSVDFSSTIDFFDI